jgi:TolB-like protein
MAERNAELHEDRRMEYRIGVNLGDVIEEGDRIYGDGVNIAARLESLAEPGGICISGFVYNQVKNRLKLEYEFMGEQTVKNIKEPVPVYRVLSFPGAAAHRVIKAKKTGEKSWHKKITISVAALVVIAVALGIWNFYLRRPSVDAADPEKMAFPLPDKPSIAVLPFDNLSGDPEQEYISDGISENIIATLSKTSRMFVVARNSTFTYKGKPVKVQQVAEELGVRYILEGSVQKSGDQLRVTGQLIDAMNGRHLWSEKYDRKMKDFFVLQDEITKKIVVALRVEVGKGESARLTAKSTDNFEAWTKVAKGVELCLKLNKEDNIKARALFEAGIKLDPGYTDAYGNGWLGPTYMM